MSKREWKPGDVLVNAGRVGIVTTAGIGRDDSGRAAYVEFGHGGTIFVGELDGDARPLVVVDPEDREQVERLVRAFWDNGNDDCDDPRAMQAALRSLIEPPKPPEPTGLGAVVEDADGKRYIRCDAGPGRWHCPDDDTGASDDFYANISAVRVLSVGVTA